MRAADFTLNDPHGWECNSLAASGPAMSRASTLAFDASIEHRLNRSLPWSGPWLYGQDESSGDIHHNGTSTILQVATSQQIAKLAPGQRTPSTSLSEDQNQVGDSNFRCPTCDRLFPRPYELERHKKTHFPDFRFQCPAVNCFKAGNRTRFSRSDKLAAHLRSVHVDFSFGCIEPGCSMKDLPRDLMFVHLQGHTESESSQDHAQAKALLNGLSPAVRQCLMSKCTAVIPLHRLRNHLLSHEQDKLSAAYEDLRDLNYECIQLGSFDSATLFGRSYPPAISDIYVICPICKSTHADHEVFREHLLANHIIKNNQHYRIWMDHVEETLDNCSVTFDRSPTGLSEACVWKAWRFDWPATVKANIKLHCPACNVAESVGHGNAARHHLSILTDNETLLRFRREILALYPNFATHPVFDDLLPPHKINRVQDFRMKKARLTSKSSEPDPGLIRKKPAKGDDALLHRVDTPLPELQPALHHTLSEPCTNPFELFGIGEQFPSSAASAFIHNSDARLKQKSPRITDRTLFTEPESLFASIGEHMHLQTDGAFHGPHDTSLISLLSAAELLPDGAKNHVCGECGVQFKRKSDLHLHHKSQERPHYCHQCEGRFKYRKDLQRHLKSHSKPSLNCPVKTCAQLFKREDYLSRHFERVHSPGRVYRGDREGTVSFAQPDSVLDRRKVLMSSLSFTQMNSRRVTIPDAQPSTCEWFLNHFYYVEWTESKNVHQHHGLLWIKGKPGVGKSTLIKFAHKQADKKISELEIITSFYFNAAGDELERSARGLYRALLLQLLKLAPHLQWVLDDVESPVVLQSSPQWTTHQLRGLLSDAIARLGKMKLICFIDGLDECDKGQAQDVVDFFEGLGLSSLDTEICVCFASRHHSAIDIRYGYQLVLEDEAGHSADLAKYVRHCLRAGKGKDVEDARAQVVEKANGVFIWAVLVVSILNAEFKKGRLFAVKQRLKQLPPEMSDLFEEINGDR